MAAPVDFRYFLLNNANDADSVYPMVYDQSGTDIVWDGSLNSQNEVPHGQAYNFDLVKDAPLVPDQTTYTFGCKVKGSGKEVKDPSKTQRRYVKTSEKQVTGNYKKDGTFSVDPPPPAGLDTASFQDAYLKINNPAVAKLLISVANLISPELA